MRSLMTFAAFVAAIGFSGCCGTGGSCPLFHGGKLGGIGKKAASATDVQSYGEQAVYSDDGGCGCEGASYEQGMMEHTPADSGCGCSASAGDGGAAACACGSDSVVSVSAPYDCGCGGGEAMSSMPAVSDGGCGCSSCGDSAPVVGPMQFSALAAGGCSACEGASTGAHQALRQLFQAQHVAYLLDVEDATATVAAKMAVVAATVTTAPMAWV